MPSAGLRSSNIIALRDESTTPAAQEQSKGFKGLHVTGSASLYY